MNGLDEQGEEMARSGKTVSFVQCDGQWPGVAVSDTLRKALRTPFRAETTGR